MTVYTRSNICGNDDRDLELESVRGENLAQAFEKCISFPN